MTSDETLRSSYVKLSRAIEELFCELWPQLRSGQVSARPQTPTSGTTHRSRDRKRFEHLLTSGWDTPVSALVGRALNQDLQDPRSD
jgi:methionyl-tRNA formyltransferase